MQLTQAPNLEKHHSSPPRQHPSRLNKQLSLPFELGQHPQTTLELEVGILEHLHARQKEVRYKMRDLKMHSKQSTSS